MRRPELTDLNVLTMTEPWASLVVDGQKQWETRHWATRYRGLLLIQAAKGFPSDARGLCYEEPFKSALLARKDLDTFRRETLFYDPVEFLSRTLGTIIGAVDLIAIARTEHVRKGLEAVALERAKNELAFGNYEKGRWAFRLEKPRRFSEPVPVRGQLMIWGIRSAETAAAVTRELGEKTTSQSHSSSEAEAP